jgi:hypothetical protein
MSEANDMILTEGEAAMLKDIGTSQLEEGMSEFTVGGEGDGVMSAEDKGTLGSLVKKGLVYDCYDAEEAGYQMYCLSLNGEKECVKMGVELDFEMFGRDTYGES